MKRYLYILLGLLAMTAAGCGDDAEVFYSITYPIGKIEGVVTGTDTGSGDTDGTTDDSTEGTTPGTDSSDESAGDGGETPSGEGSGEEPENPVFAQIEAEIVAQAPVQVGGSYTLDFTKHDRGRARINTATDAGSVTGLFFKEPGVDSIRFYYLEQDYTCLRSSYAGENGSSFVLFTVDLTDHYKELYPDAGITRVVRLEYTTTPY